MFGFGRKKPQMPMAASAPPVGVPVDGGIGPSPQFQMPGMEAGQVGLPGMPGIAAGRFKMGGMPGMNGKIGLPGMPGINANRFKMKAPPGMGGIGKAIGGLFGFGKKKKQPVMPIAPMPGAGVGIAPSQDFNPYQ